MTDLEPTEPPVPDFVRQRIRSMAQAAGSWLAVVIVANLAEYFGADAVPAGLEGWVAGALIPAIGALAILVYIVAVQLLARVAPWAETVFFARRGQPTYIDVESSPRHSSSSSTR